MASQLRKLGLLLGLVVVVTVVAIVITPKLRAPTLLSNGSTAPSFTLSGDDGTKRTVPPGTTTAPTLILFLEATCPHCQEEAPRLCRLAQQHPRTTFVGVGSALEDANSLRGFRASHMADCNASTFPLLVDPNGDVTHKYLVAAVPTVYVIDAQGKVAYTGSGTSGVDGAAAVIDRLEHG